MAADASQEEAAVKHYPGVDFSETWGFGDNPGDLDLFVHVPEGLPAGSPVVVVLHGCSQTAAIYAEYSEWNHLADRFGFALAYPQQRVTNNGTLCFNWFLPGDARRNTGEIASIVNMTQAMKTWYASDPQRVFVSGVSAGGAMAIALLATHPDLFSAGASMAALPFRAADSIAESTLAIGAMVDRDPQAWGDLARGGHPSWPGPWPRLIAFHGEFDTVVGPANLRELSEQWTSLHGLPPAASFEEKVSGHTHRLFGADSGPPALETFSLAATPHGTPVDPGTGPEQGGMAAVWFPDADLYSAWHACRFWGVAP